MTIENVGKRKEGIGNFLREFPSEDGLVRVEFIWLDKLNWRRRSADIINTYLTHTAALQSYVIKYSISDLICDVTYCASPAKMTYNKLLALL